jgi:translation initiation factor 5
VPHILKELFEADVLEEEVILEWAKKVSKKYVSKDMAQKIHEKAAPFITWLKEAEEESEESSDDDIELEFDERAKISKIKETSAEPDKVAGAAAGTNGTAGAEAQEDGEHDGEDIDIDDI